MIKRRKQLYRVNSVMKPQKDCIIFTIHLSHSIAERITKFCKEENIQRPVFMGDFIGNNIDKLEDFHFFGEDDDNIRKDKKNVF